MSRLIRVAGRQNIVIAIGLVLLASAGCSNPDAEPEVHPGPSITMQAPTLDETGNALARFDSAKAVDHSVWANGTYKIQEHFFPVHWIPASLGLMRPPGLRILDVSEHVPRGVPVRIIAELDAQVTDGDVHLWVDAPFEEVWSGEWETPPGGYSKTELRLVHVSDGPVTVNLFYDQVDRSAEFPYTLKVDIRADPERLIQAVGATLDVPMENATLVASIEAGKEESALLVWDPDAKPIGRFSLKSGSNEIQLKDAGTHMVLLAQGSGDATLAIKGISEPPRMASATQEIVAFEGEAPKAPVEWTFEAARAPIQVGFYASSSTVATDFSGVLRSPKEALIELEFMGGPWVRPLMGFGFMDWTRMGGEGLIPGTYEAKVSFAQSAGPDPIQYGHFLVYIAPG